MSRKKQHRTYIYECSLTGEKYKVRRESAHPEDLISVKAYYELNPDKDDRPLAVKKEKEMAEAEAPAAVEEQP